MSTTDQPQNRHGPEWTAQFTVPDYDVIETLEYSMLAGTSPLEDSFIRWFLVSSNAVEAFDSVRHKALPTLITLGVNVSPQELMRRPLVKQNLKAIRKLKPHLEMYTADHMIGIMHGEIENLRLRERSKRFATGTTIIGKKSINEEELNTIETLVKCLDFVSTLVKESRDASEGGSTGTPQGDLHSGLNRVLAEAKGLIDGYVANPSGSSRPTPMA